jgi:hypothetical protein
VRERFILIGLHLAVLLFVGCGGPSAESGPEDKCELDNPPLFEKGQLTVATDKPASAVVQGKFQGLLGLRGRYSE